MKLNEGCCAETVLLSLCQQQWRADWLVYLQAGHNSYLLFQQEKGHINFSPTKLDTKSGQAVLKHCDGLKSQIEKNNLIFKMNYVEGSAS